MCIENSFIMYMKNVYKKQTMCVKKVDLALKKYNQVIENVKCAYTFFDRVFKIC